MNNNNKYWKERIQRITFDLCKLQDKKDVILFKKYKKALDDIRLELFNLYSKMGKPSLTEAYKYNRLIKIEAQLTKIVKDLGVAEDKFFTESLKENYQQTSILVGKELDLNLGVNFNKIDRFTIDKALTYPWSGTDYSSRIWRNKNKLVNTLNDTLTRGLINGTSHITLAKEIKDKMGVGLYESKRLIRTETAHIINSATIDRYKKSGVVQEVQWISCHTGNTCSKCGDKDGNIYNLNNIPMLPQHPNCRCCIAPYFK